MGSTDTTWNRKLIINFNDPNSIATFSVDFAGSGDIVLRLGDSSTYLGFGIWNAQIPHWISIELLAQNAGGICNVYVDGILATTYSGDTQRTTIPGWSSMRFRNQATMWIDDMVFTTAAEGAVTPQYFVPLTLDSDFAVSLTPSTGVLNYMTVDELPVSTLDYNECNVSGLSDLYGHAGLPWTPVSVYCVAANSYVAADGTITAMQNALYASGSTSYEPVAPRPLGGGYVYDVVQSIWTLDPLGSAWTGASVDAAKIGVKFI